MDDQLQLDNNQGPINNNSGPNVVEEKKRFGDGNFYLTLEDLNKQGKAGEDIIKRCFKCLKGIYDPLLNCLSVVSCCLFVIVGIMYLVAIIWASQYDMYSLQYYDISNEFHEASIILQSTKQTPYELLSKSEVCNYYNLNCTNISYKKQTNSSISNAVLSEMSEFANWSVRVQWFLSWISWEIIRFKMVDLSLFSLKYVGYYLIQNIISWNFRSLGFLLLTNTTHVLYSAYYSNSFINGIITFIIALFCWVLLVAVCLKRKKIPNARNNEKRLVLRKFGEMNENGSVDTKSIIANVFVVLFLFYFWMAPSIWLFFDNVKKTIIDETEESSSNAWYLHSNILTWCNFLFAEIKAYFIPTFKWYFPFVLAAMAQNVLTVVDICIIILSTMRDLFEKCGDNRKRGDAKYSGYQMT